MVSIKSRTVFLPGGGESMKKFLLATVPFLRSNLRFYAVSYVAAIVKSAGWECDYIDLNRKTFNFFSDPIKSLWDSNHAKIQTEVLSHAKTIFIKELSNIDLNQYSIIGVSLYVNSQKFAEPFLQALKEVDYSGVTMYGGPDCFPYNHGRRYFNGDINPDLIFQNEAEIALPQFLKEFEVCRNRIPKVPGFLYKQDDGSIQSTGELGKPKSSDFNVIADYSIFESGYTSSMATFTSKGCINRCTFCSAWIQFAPLRQRDPLIVVEELKRQKRFISNSKVVWLRDSNFNTSQKHVVKFCRAMIDEEVNLQWWTMACFRVTFEKETISLMRKAGMAGMMLGLESASQVVLDFMGKHFDINHAQEAIAQYTHAGIIIRLPILNGFPGECTSDFLTTCAFILRYTGLEKVEFTYSNVCAVLDNSIIHDYPDDFCLEKARLHPQLWTQRNGMNIYPVRRVRMAFTMYLIQIAVLGSFDAEDHLESIDFNIPAVAVELARIIYYLGIATDKVEQSRSFFSEVCEHSPELDNLDVADSRFNVLYQQIPGLSLTSWLTADKRGLTHSKIVKFIFASFMRLGEAIDKTKFIDCKKFKASFYQKKTKQIHSSVAQFSINAIKNTEYDSGKFFIVEGTAWDKRTNEPVSMVWAEDGENVIEFHYGIPDNQREETDPLYLTGFWGKIKKSNLDVHGSVAIVLAFHDGSCSEYYVSLSDEK